MLKNQQSLSLSEHNNLYDILVPQDHFLRQMKDLIDFSFIEEELKDNYCLDNGRNAEPPVRMFQYLLLKQIYNLSDRDLVERAMYDLSFKYFLGLRPEDSVIHASTLTKFRSLRIKDISLLDILIGKTVELALEHELLESKTLIVDATHTMSRFKGKTAENYVQDQAKALRKTVYKYDETIKAAFPEKPAEDNLDNILNYTNRVIAVIEEKEQLIQLPAVREKINIVKEIVSDINAEAQYSEDLDARKGYKSSDHSFLGYKTHIAMSDERIITAAVITPGDASDTKQLKDLIEISEKNGMEVQHIIGDKAYSSKDNLIYTTSKQQLLVSRLHPIITHGKRDSDRVFEFNKDANMFVCPAGHLATSKYVMTRKDSSRNNQEKYFFDVKKCKVCPLREGCYTPNAKTKTYSIIIKSSEHQDQEDFQETDMFKTLSKKRYKIEAKNSELKNRHGYKKANSSGLFGMNIQGATTIFVANMKRIIKLINEK